MRRLFTTCATTLGQTCLGLAYIHLLLFYASAPLAAILYGLFRGMAGNLVWWQWVLLSPAIYVAWLNTFLIACGIEMQFWKPVTGYQKPRRATNGADALQWIRFFQTMGLYIRQRMVWSLPLTQAYMCFPGLRHLVLWSYSQRTRIASSSVVLGCLYDPDLTEVGDDCIIGAGATISAHSFTRNLDGTALLVTAPVIVEARGVVGGNARIDPGVRIGADAIVEPSSYVTAFTTIGPGEVWAGAPARFVRLRQPESEQVVASASSESSGDGPMTIAIPAADTIGSEEQALREIVAAALDRPATSVTANLTAEQCAAWDSLGQLAIAAGVQQKFGIVVPASESFRLRSMADIRTLIRESRLGAARRAS